MEYRHLNLLLTEEHYNSTRILPSNILATYVVAPWSTKQVQYSIKASLVELQQDKVIFDCLMLYLFSS